MINEPASNLATKFIDAEGVTIGASLLLRERTEISGVGPNQIATVLALDPASNDYGLTVRDPNTTAVVARLGQTLTVGFDPGHTLGAITTVGSITSSVAVYVSATAGTLQVKLDPASVVQISNTPTVTANVGTGTMAVYFDQSNPSVKANAGLGTFNVQLDPGHTLGNIGSLNQIATTVNVQLDPGHTIGSISTLGSITNTVAVFFSPASPAVSATFSAASIEVIPTTGSRKITDDASASQRVLIVGSQANASLLISGAVTANAGTGTFTVGGDIVSGGTDSGNPVKIGGVYRVTKPSVADGQRVDLQAGIRGSLATTLFNQDSTQPLGTGIADNADGATATSSLVKMGVSSRNTILNSSGTWDRMRGGPGVSDAAVRVVLATDSNGSMTIVGQTSTLNVQFDPGHELGSIKGITNSINVYLGATAGTVAIKIDPGYNVVGDQSTLVIPIPTAGSTSGVSVSGTTIAGPTASRVLKVYALSLTTTAQTSLTAKFTNGAGTSPTVFYEAALQAPAQGISGTNMAVTPPGYLFATAAGSTLALVLDSASKVHYFISYFEESA